MGRKNTKKQVINYQNSIKKSNELSMAELNYGLTLNQMQLFAFAIFSTQQNGKTEFKKHEFQKKFEIEQYRTDDAFEDSEKIMDLKVSVKEPEKDAFKFINVFMEMEYEKGNFKFEWNPSMITHILELKQRYVITDLEVASHFKSRFSWRLYDYLRAHFGYWHIEITKEELMKLFGVSEVLSYQKGTAHFKRRVLDVAIKEINQYTELEIWYTEQKVGNKIIGFVIQWSTGERVSAATEKQLSLLRELFEEVDKNLFDYLSLKNVEELDQARRYIIEIKEMEKSIKKGVTSQEASEAIKEVKGNYDLLENMLENDGKVSARDIYYNWLED